MERQVSLHEGTDFVSGRDEQRSSPAALSLRGDDSGPAEEQWRREDRHSRQVGSVTVSYTHLTLPTIYSV